MGAEDSLVAHRRPRLGAIRGLPFAALVLAGLVCAGLGLTLGCAGGATASGGAAASGVSYSFGTPEGGLLDDRSMRGRVTVLLFATTFDIASQEQARRLDVLHRSYEPRLNVLCVMLEPPRNVELVRTFRQMLELSYEVAMAGPELLAGDGPFGDVRAVPSWVVLDRDGEFVAAHAGPLTDQDLRRLVDRSRGGGK